MEQRYCLFDTAFGPCAIAWSERGVVRLQLPSPIGPQPNGA